MFHLSMTKLLESFTKRAKRIRDIEEARIEKEEGVIAGLQEQIIDSEESIEASKEEIRKADAFISKFEDL